MTNSNVNYSWKHYMAKQIRQDKLIYTGSFGHRRSLLKLQICRNRTKVDEARNSQNRPSTRAKRPNVSRFCRFAISNRLHLDWLYRRSVDAPGCNRTRSRKSGNKKKIKKKIMQERKKGGSNPCPNLLLVVAT